jgi:hypothetical protein
LTNNRENDGSTLLRNVGKKLPNITAQQPYLSVCHSVATAGRCTRVLWNVLISVSLGFRLNFIREKFDQIEVR